MKPLATSDMIFSPPKAEVSGSNPDGCATAPLKSLEKMNCPEFPDSSNVRERASNKTASVGEEWESLQLVFCPSPHPLEPERRWIMGTELEPHTALDFSQYKLYASIPTRILNLKVSRSEPQDGIKRLV